MLTEIKASLYRMCFTINDTDTHLVLVFCWIHFILLFPRHLCLCCKKILSIFKNALFLTTTGIKSVLNARKSIHFIAKLSYITSDYNLMTPFFITKTYRDEFQILLDLYNTITKVIANQNAMSI